LKFARQLPVGPHFADFACREAALIVELDGSQHAWSMDDHRRTARLNREGYSVLRFWNEEVVRDRDAVIEAIRSTIAGNPSPDWRFAPATLSPRGRGTRRAKAALSSRVAKSARLVRSEDIAEPFLSPSGRGWPKAG
jgi:hypothetical protein